MKRYYILLFLSVLLWSCSNDEENFEQTDINLVTGLDLRQTQESTPFRLGNPNTFTENLFIIYPNPAVNSIWISSSEIISNVWILPAKPSKNFSGIDFSKSLNSDLFSKNDIDINSIEKFENLNWSQMALNIENLGPGYYKVFVEINGDLFWDNIYVSNNPNESEINNLKNYWN